MTGAPWLEIAVRELVAGVQEIRGERHNLRIMEYHATTEGHANGDETAWCSSFVNWCMRQAWVKGTGSKAARSWEKWGRRLARPVPGCVVVLWREKPDGWKGHVGLFLGFDGPNRIVMLGGNQGNEVSVSAYAINRLLSYRWPTEEDRWGTRPAG